MKVGVKFCGNCNPHKDMTNVLQTLMALEKSIQFVSWQETPYDVLLILSGCPVDCATRPEFIGSHVIVTSESVDHVLAAESDLPFRILDALQKYRK
jgi:hypothetical protein